MRAEELLSLGERLIDATRPTPAVAAFEQARAQATTPWVRVLASYNAGAVNWDRLGNGLAARKAFLEAASLEGPDYDEPRLLMMRSNALENLMLSALSFEEFYAFADRLRALTPAAPVLGGLSPVAEELRDSGAPWSHMMVHLATMNYFRGDPTRDRGRYGVARATYHLVLAHRKALRLSREDWRMVVYEFCALSMRMTADYTKARGDDDEHPPDEYLPVLVDALPYVDEYLAALSGDQAIREIRGNMAKMIEHAQEGWLARQHTAGATSDVPFGRASSPRLVARCRQCHQDLDNPLVPCPSCGTPSPVPMTTAGITLAVAVTGGLAAWQLLASYGLVIRLAAGIAAALFLLFLVGPVVFQASLRWLIRRAD